MNNILQKFARDTLKAGLAQLPSSNQYVFKCMYSFNNLDKDINDVIDTIPAEKLDWAMTQVQNSLDKLQKN